MNKKLKKEVTVSKLKDIRVVRPEDKLLILCEDAPAGRLAGLVEAVEAFMKQKNRRVLVVKDMQPYIIRGGAKISLAMLFEEMLDKEGK